MIYDSFNALSESIGAVWSTSGIAKSSGGIITGIIFWFAVERLLGLIATPLFKGASIAFVLLLTFMTLSIFHSFGTYSSVERPPMSIEETNRLILKDALK